MLIRITDGVPEKNPIVETNFRQLFPNTSFPFPLAPADVEGMGYGIYERTEEPDTDKYEKAVEGLPVKGEDDIWRQFWSVEDMTTEERQEVDNVKAGQVRSLRSRDLWNSDWTQVADAQVDKGSWAAYRQLLRDIPSQSGFPWDVTWPEEPT
tara:strand:- start:632 stop:1087 length:456 start_codon:yes stop_codon:yes gene_type:complete